MVFLEPRRRPRKRSRRDSGGLSPERIHALDRWSGQSDGQTGISNKPSEVRSPHRRQDQSVVKSITGTRLSSGQVRGRMDLPENLL